MKVSNKDYMKVEGAVWKKTGFSGMRGLEKVTDKNTLLIYIYDAAQKF